MRYFFISFMSILSSTGLGYNHNCVAKTGCFLCVHYNFLLLTVIQLTFPTYRLRVRVVAKIQPICRHALLITFLVIVCNWSTLSFSSTPESYCWKSKMIKFSILSHIFKLWLQSRMSCKMVLCVFFSHPCFFSHACFFSQDRGGEQWVTGRSPQTCMFVGLCTQLICL